MRQHIAAVAVSVGVSLVMFAVPLGAAGAADAEAAASSGLPTASPEDVGMSSERLARVGEAVQGYIDRGEVAGTVTLVARKGKVVHLEARGMSATPRRWGGR